MIEIFCCYYKRCRIQPALSHGIILLTIYICQVMSVRAQVSIEGQVKDIETGKGIPGVTISLTPGGERTASDSLGYYRILSTGKSTQIEFRTLGYQTLTENISGEGKQVLNVQMEIDFTLLDDIVINQRGKYRNRGNPAVALLEKVIEAKPRHSLDRFAYAQIDFYNKNMIALSGLPGFIRDNWITKGYKFIFENLDTTTLPGYRLLPAFLEETQSRQYQGFGLGGSKTFIQARKMTELDPRYVDNSHIHTYMRFLQETLDLYSKDIKIAGKAFLSPIADISPYFYRYFITDTIRQEDREYVELTFLPRNMKSYLFSGKLQVDLENYGINHAHLQVDQTANFNWVKRLDIDFSYRYTSEYGYLPKQADFAMLAALPSTKTGIYASRTQVFESFDIQNNIPGDLDFQHNIDIDKPDSYWRQHRPVPLSPTERQTYANMDSLKTNRSFKRTLSWASFLSDGFIQAGPLDLGPLEYAYSFNDLEGSRIRLGAKTGKSADRPYYAEGYLAYGTRDERFKYFLHGAYSLKGSIADFPLHYLEGSYQQDVRQPGYEMSYLNGDSFFQSFRRADDPRFLFKQKARLSHLVEFKNHISLRTHIARLQQAPAYGLLFNTGGPAPDTLSNLIHSEIGILLRWAPHEQIIQKQLERSNIPNQYPIFNIQYSMGIPGFLGGTYRFQQLKASVYKRLYLSVLGISDVQLGAGYIWGELPYLLLDIPNANLSYLFSPDSYQLLNEMEFVNDHYIKLDVQHHFEGLLLNRIPLIKKLGWRESMGFKLLYGGLRDENNPQSNPRSIRFPLGEKGGQSTFAMSDKPYMEFSVGLENILNFLQVQYIRRLSYLDHPDADKQGFRFSIKFDF